MNRPLYAMLTLVALAMALVSFCSYHAIGVNDGPLAGLVVFGTACLCVLAAMVSTIAFVVDRP